MSSGGDEKRSSGRRSAGMALPPRPEKRLPPVDVRGEPRIYLPSEMDVEVPVPTIPPPARASVPLPAELDEATRSRVAEAIARAIAAELGSVRISSVPPPSSEPPRSSMRVAADVGGKVGKWGIKWGVLGSGALALAGQVIVWTMKPEYAAPLGQALKLIGAAILAAMGNGPPSGDSSP
jgi:hypothetical protein